MGLCTIGRDGETLQNQAAGTPACWIVIRLDIFHVMDACQRRCTEKPICEASGPNVGEEDKKALSPCTDF